MADLTRRDFTRGALSTVLAYSLLETLFENDAFSDEIKPLTGKWLTEVNQVARDLKDEKIKQVSGSRKSRSFSPGCRWRSCLPWLILIA